MIVVLDTNVLLSGLIEGDAPPQLLLGRWYERQFTVAASGATLEELKGILVRPYWIARLASRKGVVEELLQNLHENAFVPPSTGDIPVFAADPKDAPILALAIDANADYIVSGDKKHILKLGEYNGIPIISPREFLDFLEARR